MRASEAGTQPRIGVAQPRLLFPALVQRISVYRMVYTSPLPHRDPVPEVLRSFGEFLLGLEGIRCRLKNYDVDSYLRARLEYLVEIYLAREGFPSRSAPLSKGRKRCGK